MRVTYVIPGPMSKTALGAEEIARRERILRDWAPAGVDVTVRDVDSGPGSIESAYEEYVSVQSSARLVSELEADGVDAVILGCYGDPGLDALYELTTDLVVVGPGEASAHVAAMLGQQIGIVTVADGVVNPIRHLMARAGLGGSLAGVGVVDVPVLELGDDRDEAVRRAAAAARRLIDERGADVIVLGCMSMAFLDLGADIEQKLGVPVVNPVKASLGVAHLRVHFGLRHSKLAYPTPRKISAGASLAQLWVE